MPQKLRRRGPRVFHRRRYRPLKIILWVAGAAVLVTGGFFGAKYMIEGLPHREAKVSSVPASSQPADSSVPPVSSEPVTPPAGTVDRLRAVYLPLSRLTDAAGRDALLDQTAAAGFNAVLFDLKGENGDLYYVSATELAVQSKATAADALPMEELAALATRMREKGLLPLPRLYAFKDHKAPYQLHTAKIQLDDNHAWTWLDNSKDKGGKPWLNPYSADAHRYILGLLEELKGVGFTAVMLDGVQFPLQTSSAYFGDGEWKSLSKGDMLKKFVEEATQTMGDGDLLLAAPGLATLGDGTAPYGGNPLTQGAKTVAPILLPSTLGSRIASGEETLNNPADHPYDAVRLALSQVRLRLQLMDEAERPLIVPWLQAEGYSATQVGDQIRAVKESGGEDAPYILYHPDGAYDMTALNG